MRCRDAMKFVRYAYSFIYLFSGRSKESTRDWGRLHAHAVAAAAAAATAKTGEYTYMHNVKRFATLVLPMSFRCHGDVIIDKSRFFSVILGDKQIVHTRHSQRLATATLRISFRCHVGAIIVVFTFAGCRVPAGC